MRATRLLATAALLVAGWTGCGAAGWTVAVPPPPRLPATVDVQVEGRNARDQDLAAKLASLLLDGLRGAGYRTARPGTPPGWWLRVEITALDRSLLQTEQRLYAQLVVRGFDARGTELFFLTLERRTYPRAGIPAFKVGPHLVELADVIVARLPAAPPRD
jgi:hypothetical protein